MYSWVEKYIGIPFLSGGRTESGCDCWGFIRLVFKNEYGYELPVISGDYTNALNVSQTKKLFCDMIPIITGEKIKEPEERAIAIISVRNLPCHIGLYAGDDYIIHSKYGIGVCLEKIESPKRTGTIEGWYRINESYCTTKPIYKADTRI